MKHPSTRRLRALVGLACLADRRRAALMVVLGVLVGCCATAVGVVFKLLTDAVVDMDRAQALTAAVLLALAGTFQNAGGRYVLLVVSDLHDAATLVVTRDLMRLAGETPGLEHHERPEYLDRMALLRQDTRLLADALRQGVAALVLVIRVVSTAVVLATVHPALLALPAFSLPSLWAGARSRRIGQRAREVTAADGRLLDHLLEVSSSIPGAIESRVYSLGEELTERSGRLWEHRTDVLARAQLKSSLAQGLGWATFAVGYAVAIAWVVYRAADGAATAGDVILVVVLAAQVNGQVSQSLWILGSSLDAARSVERWLWLRDYATEALQHHQGREGCPRPLVDGIHFDDVTFRYPGTDRDVLCNVDLHLPAGATVAIVGENGAGKTTLVKLLCRFYEPTSGRITVDGIDLRDIDAAEWRSHLSGCFQDFTRLELLLRESVGAGDLERIEDGAAVARALARTEGSGIAAQLDGGLEAQLGRQFDGAELSSGQWQKVAAARALMRRVPTLLVLDEPSSNLDPRAEHALLERYAAAAQEVSDTGAITVLVSHRFSTVRRADCVVVIDGGRVVEAGSHEELVAGGGLYAQLYGIQSRAYA